MPPLFEEEMKLIEESIEDFKEGERNNVAIISDPFYGESNLMKSVWDIIGPRALRVDGRSLIRNFEVLETTSENIVMVNEAHRLYQRKIGGFFAMNRFLSFVYSSNSLFITAWNSYSWKYLDEVLDLGRHFPQKVRLSKMGTDQIREMLLSGYEEGELTFVEEAPRDAEKLNIFNRSSYKKTLMGHSLEIPYPVVDVRSIRSRLTKSEKKSSEDLFFEKLARISDGNPGVAEYLWKEALEYPEVRSNLKDPPSIDLNYDESFALSIVLSMGSVEVGELSDILKPLDLSAERITGLLEERRLVFSDGDVIAIRSEALKSVVEHLRRLRLVW